MHPVLFWTLGVISLAAGVMAVGHPRPIKTLLGLLILMMANGLILLLLAATLVAIEWFVVNLGGMIVIWTILVRPKKLSQGPPGRARFNITKLLALAVAVCFMIMIVWSAVQHVGPVGTCAAAACVSEKHVAWISLFLLGMSTVASCVVVLSRNRQHGSGDRR